MLFSPLFRYLFLPFSLLLQSHHYLPFYFRPHIFFKIVPPASSHARMRLLAVRAVRFVPLKVYEFKASLFISPLLFIRPHPSSSPLPPLFTCSIPLSIIDLHTLTFFSVRSLALLAQFVCFVTLSMG
ncbi:hypothetical protein BOTBODRAFT_206383 [Botryobasidium botryosum FD-172 SS1]|uniref:Uncharacterized protein n=1 Tax=Botryobasidium botryosum (strain FD-172 SS1) TaxID=930990 RepID=A0A067N0L5_BOTB1|nr:hypothetical protein BOTBODRAFT_206383 [Botryobasidium botryosum FD-172 SS1]